MNQKEKSSIATKGALVGVFVYIILATSKIIAGNAFHSSSLRADGFNNLSDIISSLAALIGIQIAKKPADDDHHFDHNKYETLASFIISIIIFTIGFNVLVDGVKRFITGETLETNPLAIWVSIISSIILFIAYLYIRHLAKISNSIGLKATAHDMRNDILITLSTIVGILASSFGYPMIDTIVAIIVGVLTIYSAYEIFKETTFALSDGFDKEALEDYKNLILKHPKVQGVENIRGRLSGQKIYLDVTILIDGHMTVIESHNVTEEVEQMLKYNYGVHDTDVHVEPHFP